MASSGMMFNGPGTVWTATGPVHAGKVVPEDHYVLRAVEDATRRPASLGDGRAVSTSGRDP